LVTFESIMNEEKGIVFSGKKEEGERRGIEYVSRKEKKKRLSVRSLSCRKGGRKNAEKKKEGVRGHGGCRDREY